METMEDIKKKFPLHTFELIAEKHKGPYYNDEDWYYCEKNGKGEIISYYHEWSYMYPGRNSLGIKKYSPAISKPPF